MLTLEQIEAIRRLNDAARTNLGVTSIANATAGFQSLPDGDRFAALAAVVGFSRFDADNDPYGEHDFGTIYRLAPGRWTQDRPKDSKAITETVFWKVDLYDPGLVKFALNGSFC